MINKFILVSLIISAAYAHPWNRHLCLPLQERNLDGECDNIQRPVCAYLTDAECQPGVPQCTKQFDSPCLACKDETIKFWREGECGIVDDSIEYCLHEVTDKECDLSDLNIFRDVVCGYEYGLGLRNVYPNRCVACARREVDFVKPGFCTFDGEDALQFLDFFRDKNRYFCNKPWVSGNLGRDFRICLPNDIQPVCGIAGDQFTEINQYDNGCFACNDGEVDFFVQSTCAEVKNVTQGISYCSIAEKDDTFKCDGEEDQPVCGHFFNDGQKLSTDLEYWRSQTFYKNRCLACKNTRVDYVTDGECLLFVPIPIPVPIPVFIPLPIIDNVGSTNFRFCPAERDNNVICTAEYKPICGVWEDCTGADGECWQTFVNQCLACSNIMVDLIFEGDCLSNMDNLKRLQDLSNRITIPRRVRCNTRCSVCTENVQKPVCGFRETCLVDTPCFSTYENPCLACADVQIGFYYDGECEVSIANSGVGEC